MLSNRPLSRDVADTANIEFTGSLVVEGAGEIQFLLGTPVHASSRSLAGALEGEAAVRNLARAAVDGRLTHRQERGVTGASLPHWTTDHIIAVIEEETAAMPARDRAPEPTAGAIPARPLLLPAGHTMIADVPLSSTSLGALMERVTTGLIVITAPTPQDPRTVAVLGAVNGRPIDGFFHDGERLLWGVDAIEACPTLAGASVSVHLLDADVVALVPEIMRAPALYEGLELSWLVWPKLVSDLRKRDGLTVCEIETPTGCGTLVIRDHETVLAITSDHLAPGAPEAVNALAESELGTLRIRHTLTPGPAVKPRQHLTGSKAQRLIHTPDPVSAMPPAVANPTLVDTPAEQPAPELPGPIEEPALMRSLAPTEEPAPMGSLAPQAAAPSEAPLPLTTSPDIDTAIASTPASADDFPFSDDLDDLDGLFKTPEAPTESTVPELSATSPSPATTPNGSEPRVTAAMLPDLQEAVATELGPHNASRVLPTLDKAVAEQWTIEVLRQTVASQSIAAVAKPRMARLADALAAIVQGAD